MVSRSRIRAVGASAPNALNSWLPDLGSNQGPADQQPTAELQPFNRLAQNSFRKVRQKRPGKGLKP